MFLTLLFFQALRMPRKENLISEIHQKKGTWKLAVRITDMWFVQKGGGNSEVHMVLMDHTVK